ncbi:hydrogenase maturation protease [Methanolobus profundi]|uniref:hydrogenase maturation protease n=1 Tax=Methanolobus profundi TaxID=487685 RepID=UPI002481BE1B|nr:hydrogenase maturation protease [Methanolobus profundi]
MGFGNPLMGDDGIGIHVIEHLKQMHAELPDNVEVIDAGVCGFDALGLLEGAEKLIIVDSVKGVGDIGSIHRFVMDDIRKATSRCHLSLHGTCLADVLCMAEHIQEIPEELIIFAVEVDRTDDISLCISDRVQASLNEIVTSILDELGSGAVTEQYIQK